MRYKLLKNIPLLNKGHIFEFDIESGYVYGVEKDKVNEHPLRSGLAGYLWLLRTEKGYFRKTKNP